MEMRLRLLKAAFVYSLYSRSLLDASLFDVLCMGWNGLASLFKGGLIATVDTTRFSPRDRFQLTPSVCCLTRLFGSSLYLYRLSVCPSVSLLTSKMYIKYIKDSFRSDLP